MLSEKEYQESIQTDSDVLYQFICRTTSNNALAKESVLDIYKLLWKKKASVPKGEVKLWLYKNAYYTLLNDIRRKGTSYTYSSTSFSNAPSKQVYSNQVKSTFKNLPYTDKCILFLRDIEGFSYQTISEILSIEEESIKQSLFKSRYAIVNSLKKPLVS